MDVKSILGVYKSGIPKDDAVIVHTPDPSKYHDPSSLALGTTGDHVMAAIVGRSHGYAGWRGTIIPHATELGGSMGHNAHVPVREVYIDPELNNRSIVVDMSQFSGDSMKAAMAAASSEARAMLHDPKDAAVVTWGQFARRPGEHTETPTELTIKQGDAQASRMFEEQRQPPLQMPGVYVVPKASPGGGQVVPTQRTQLPPAAAFTRPRPQSDQSVPQVLSPPPVEAPPIQATPQLAADVRSLHDAFGGDDRPMTQPSSTFKPLRRVVFELPAPFGQFQVQYHDVIRQDMLLVLVYDHSRPMQMVWFPPSLEGSSGEPAAIATLVVGDHNEQDMLYLVYPTGLKFMYEGKEFVILTIDKEKPMKKGTP
jgi:hypothetical protein